MKKILVTTAASGVGQSAVDSLLQSGKYRIIGCGIDSGVYVKGSCNDFVIVPSFNHSTYLDKIEEIVNKYKIDLIIPGYDYELLLFANNIERFNKIGVEVIVSKPDLIEISRDKYLWYKFFSEKGCNIVSTFRLSEFKKNINDNIFPAIVKPTGGSASQGIYIVHNKSELEKLNDDDIIQPYLFPLKSDPNYYTILNFVRDRKFTQLSEISIQLVFTKDSKFGGVFISKNSLKNGVPVFVDHIDYKKFEYYFEIEKYIEVCKKYKVVGPVNIQGRITEKGLVFFEMNMRFTGITGNRAMLGFNEVEYLINNFTDNQSALDSSAINRLGVRQVACTTIPRDNNTIKNVTIIGSGGFVGEYLVDRFLIDNNFKTINLICRESSIKKYKKKFCNPKFKVLSINDYTLQEVLNRTDLFINLAGVLANKKEADTYDFLRFIRNISNLLTKANVPYILNLSSQSVYSDNEELSTEKSLVINDNLYSFQKLFVEDIFCAIKENCPSSKVVSLRCSRIIGVNREKSTIESFFATIINKVKKGNKVEINTPEDKYNLIWIEDLLDSMMSIVKLMKKNNIPDVINIGGENIKLLDYCNKVLQYLGLNNNQFIFSENTKKRNYTLNTELINSFNISPKYNVLKIIKLISDFYDNNA